MAYSRCLECLEPTTNEDGEILIVDKLGDAHHKMTVGTAMRL